MMFDEHTADAEHRREHLVSLVLRGGVITSGILLALGFVLYASQPMYHDIVQPAAEFYRILAWDAVALADPFLYLYAGLLALMFTPVLRIVIAAWMFARSREWKYVLISSVVFAVIVASIVYALGEL